MNETTTSKPIPTSFKVIGILAILWNIFGVLSFIGHTFLAEQAFDGMTDAQVAYMQSYPTWGYIVFAIAVFAGLLGSIGLLMKKKWAVPAFLVSLIAIPINQFYPLLFTNYMEIFGGASTLVLPILIFAIGALLWWYAKRAEANGWLS